MPWSGFATMGPAPVPIAEFSEQVNGQKLTVEAVTVSRVRDAVRA
jgi:hypothetical protein